MDRHRLARYAAPAAFLAAITIGALVVRAGFDHGKQGSNTPNTTVTVNTKTTHKHAHKRRLRTYTVQSGDTLGSTPASIRRPSASVRRSASSNLPPGLVNRQ
jgi:hypothetical protein